MEVAIAVTGDTEFQLTAMTIGGAGTITITLIARICKEKLAALGEHHTLKHDLH